MKYWRKYHPDIDAADPRYNQVSLIYSVLLIMVAYFGIIGVLNITLFDAADIAFYDFIGLALAVSIYLFVSRGGNFQVASWAVMATLIIILFAFVHLAEGRNYSLLWATMLPPIAFFLLGRRGGSWISGLVFLYFSWYLYQLLSQGVTANLSLGALFNFVEVATAQIFLFRFYERSRQEAYEQLQKTSITDPLTGVFNRLYLDNALKKVLSLASRNKQPVSVLLLDVDHFKRINDEHGHLVGDLVLVALCKVLEEATRESDSVGRWGGEEFLVICPNTDEAQAKALGERIIEQVREKAVSGGIHVTVSIGAATFNQVDEKSIERLLQVADNNMYKAKAAGRNQVVSTALVAS